MCGWYVQDAVCRCLIDIAAGMDYLHSLGVLHGARHITSLIIYNLAYLICSIVECSGRRDLRFDERNGCAGDLKGANVLLKSTNDDPRGYTCKVAASYVSSSCYQAQKLLWIALHQCCLRSLADIRG